MKRITAFMSSDGREPSAQYSLGLRHVRAPDLSTTEADVMKPSKYFGKLKRDLNKPFRYLMFMLD
jgi:hypothetical protein